LKADGYIQSTFDDLVDPENWVAITESGRQFLKAGLRDAIDLRLAEIREHLIELRAGMWDAAGRKSPDAPRQAASSARELVDQLLKEGAPVECETRKQRISHLLKKHSTSGGASKSDIEIIEGPRLFSRFDALADPLEHAPESQPGRIRRRCFSPRREGAAR
jgi:Predicted pPIWI-associating nuclease